VTPEQVPSRSPFDLPGSPSGDYCCQANLDLFTDPEAEGLATQAAAGRYLRPLAATDAALQVQLCEDDYIAWLPRAQLGYLVPAAAPYQPQLYQRPEIEARLPAVIDFLRAAMQVPHCYRWGGTVAPDYDCSGLIQAAFAAQGIWLPRDSYQQAAFVEAIAWEALQPGDLIFFQETTRVNHVALYLGNGEYIHSSGREKGRNGIGLDTLASDGSPVGRRYYPYLHAAGRVMQSYCPARYRAPDG